MPCRLLSIQTAKCLSHCGKCEEQADFTVDFSILCVFTSFQSHFSLHKLGDIESKKKLVLYFLIFHFTFNLIPVLLLLVKYRNFLGSYQTVICISNLLLVIKPLFGYNVEKSTTMSYRLDLCNGHLMLL